MKGFLKVEEAVCAKPMLELIWNPILSLLGAAFEDTESAGVVSRCLESFRRIIRLTSLLECMSRAILSLRLWLN